ncbi:uncharacterized protein LOC129571240 [Sitodiplosis mosellana]|uniref:uncharacterized protein LOC129571240 n=1 Tax=Sitodiplosis mosellana TaxID=263140 RepID=UPI00244453CB|nr:uncharacterized protein LOC129571240 [Sitodiplosis mosellana]
MKRLHKPADNDDPRHFKLVGEHMHAGDARKLNKKKAMTKLKDLATNSKDPIREVISKSIANTSKATKAKLPSEKVMAKMISRYRRKPGMPKNAHTLSELVLEGEYRETATKQPFLLYDSFEMMEGEEIDEYTRDRTLFFTTKENLKFLSLCDEYFMDGTFTVTPPLFSQFYTIHGRYKGWHVPLVYMLLTNKKQETYEDALKVLCELEPTLNPTDFMIDFEMGAINAIRANFPESEIHGCHFHFTQNIWRHIQLVGLQKAYNEDDDVALNLRHLIALAFVPEHSVEAAYEELIETEFFKAGDPKIDELLDYFQATYIYAFDRKGGKKAPLFEIKLWNVYETVLSGFPRTNNHIEGWHNKVNRMWGAHPNIFTFIDQLKKEQDMTEMAIAQVEGGKEPGARRTKYENEDQKLIKLVKKFDQDIHDGSFMPYLLSIAHNNRY